MADSKQSVTMTGKHALDGEIKGVFHLEVKLSKRYIWIMKLRYIWAVIRAKVGE